MKPNEQDALLLENSFLHQLLALPDKIIKLHSVASLPQMLLHELCHDSCFSINRAAYLIDNPDFNCVRGVAGFCRQECAHHKADVWSDPHAFDHDMEHAPYHREVKSFIDQRGCSGVDYLQDDLAVLGKKLGIENPLSFTWTTRHDNQGILLVEGNSCSSEDRRRLLYNVLSLLSLC